MTCRRILGLVLALTAAASEAHPQVVVHDPTSYASLVRQAQTALDQLNSLRSQLDEARRLHDSLNLGSGAGALAPTLRAPELRAFLPDLDAYLAAARGDPAALGAIGRRAAEIRSTERLHAGRPGDPRDRDLERAGDRAARDLAVGEQAARAGAARLAGLEQLAAGLDAAPSARAVMDLQARLAAEQAMTANDQMRLQGLAMAQAAEARLEAQRARERAAAAARARLDLLRGSFR